MLSINRIKDEVVHNNVSMNEMSEAIQSVEIY